MALTAHAFERVEGRLTAAGVDPAKARRWAELQARKHPHGRVGVRLFTVDFQGTPWADDSNGDQVWAICDCGKVVTVMFRRSTQPATPHALRVDRVVIAS